MIWKQKNGFNANEESDGKNPDSWIDVKKNTDILDKELIEKTLFGEAYKRFEEIELSIKLERFSIDDLPYCDDI